MQSGVHCMILHNLLLTPCSAMPRTTWEVLMKSWRLATDYDSYDSESAEFWTIFYKIIVTFTTFHISNIHNNSWYHTTQCYALFVNKNIRILGESYLANFFKFSNFSYLGHFPIVCNLSDFSNFSNLYNYSILFFKFSNFSDFSNFSYFSYFCNFSNLFQ